MGKATKTVALASDSLQKVEGYKKTRDEEVAKLWEELSKERESRNEEVAKFEGELNKEREM